MPDFDVDFCMNRRDGSSSTSQSTAKTTSPDRHLRLAVRQERAQDVGRVIAGMPSRPQRSHRTNKATCRPGRCRPVPRSWVLEQAS